MLLHIKDTGVIGDDVMQTINDPFMGLAELTHCFAGEDVYFFRTPMYSYIRRHFRLGEMSMLMNFLRLMNKIERFFLHIARIRKGRAAFNDRW